MDRMTHSAEKELADATAELARVINQEAFIDPFMPPQRGRGVRGNLAAKQASQQRAHQVTQRIQALKLRINELRTRVEDERLNGLSNQVMLQRLKASPEIARNEPSAASEAA